MHTPRQFHPARCQRHLLGSIFAALTLAAISLSSVVADHHAKASTQTAESLTIKQTIQYLLFLPRDYEEKEAWPMIVFLHGAGERGDDIDRVKVHGPPKIVENKPDFPFIVLSPQCPAGRWWSTDLVLELVEKISDTHKVDRERVYLTGLSMGGYGTWDIASRDRYRFAAIAPICGGGNPSRARFMQHLPIWVFHGAKDQVVPLSQSQDMVDALKEAGAEGVKFTIYPEANHDSWTESYANPELYEWFLSHRKQERPARRRR